MLEGFVLISFGWEICCVVNRGNMGIVVMMVVEDSSLDKECFSTAYDVGVVLVVDFVAIHWVGNVNVENVFTGDEHGDEREVCVSESMDKASLSLYVGWLCIFAVVDEITLFCMTSWVLRVTC